MRGSPGFSGCIHLITAVSVRCTLTAANSAELPQRPPHLPVSSSFLQAAAPLLLHYDPGEGSMAALTVSLLATTASTCNPDCLIKQLQQRNIAVDGIKCTFNYIYISDQC